MNAKSHIHTRLSGIFYSFSPHPFHVLKLVFTVKDFLRNNQVSDYHICKYPTLVSQVPMFLNIYVFNIL